MFFRRFEFNFREPKLSFRRFKIAFRRFEFIFRGLKNSFLRPEITFRWKKLSFRRMILDVGKEFIYHKKLFNFKINSTINTNVGIHEKAINFR